MFLWLPATYLRKHSVSNLSFSTVFNAIELVNLFSHSINDNGQEWMCVREQLAVAACGSALHGAAGTPIWVKQQRIESSSVSNW